MWNDYADFAPTEHVKSSVLKNTHNGTIPMNFTRNNSQYIPDTKAKFYDLKVFAMRMYSWSKKIPLRKCANNTPPKINMESFFIPSLLLRNGRIIITDIFQNPTRTVPIPNKS